MNPVLPSPWRSSAPLGYSKRPKRRHSYRRDLDIYKKTSVSKKIEESKMEPEQFYRQDFLFRSLNRNTLILSFPEVDEKHIDKTLDVCNNNLSVAIGFIKKKLDQAKENVKRYQLNKSIVPGSPQSSTQMNLSQSVLKPIKGITYIPTKYKDVEIVELNNNVNNIKLFNISAATQIIPLKGNGKFIPILPRILPKILPAPLQVSQESTPACLPILPAFPQQSVSSTVENNRGKLQHKSLSPNQILERALTFYPPYTQDN